MNARRRVEGGEHGPTDALILASAVVRFPEIHMGTKIQPHGISLPNSSEFYQLIAEVVNKA